MRKSFTLIELLVVVAIIAVLVAILLPALSKARDIAQISVCLSNEHQQAMAMFAYQADYNGYFAPSLTWWGGISVYTRLEPYTRTLEKQDVRHPKGLWVCPADPLPQDYPNTYPPNNWRSCSSIHGQYEYVSYGINMSDNSASDPYEPYGLYAFGNGPDGTNRDKVRRESEIQYPTRTAMFAEGSYSRTHIYWAPGKNTALPVNPYHGSGKETNILACDGHAVRFADLELTKPYYDANGKWCLPEYWYRIDQ